MKKGRIMRGVIAFWAVLLGIAFLATPIRAAGPGAGDLERIATGFENTGRVRVLTAGHTYTLARPRVESAGLAFDEVVRPSRPAVVASAWDTLPALHSPIAWENVERIDAQVSHRGRNVLVGAVVGAVVGGLAITMLGNVVHEEPEEGLAAQSAVIGGLVGAGLGAILTTPHWRPVYPTAAR
jgi:hypothetical protein